MTETPPPLLADKLAWDGNTLVVTGDGLIEKKLRRKALSPSTSKSMQSCGARWVGERLLRNEEENPFDPAPLGTSGHKVLEDMYGLEPQERSMETARSLLLADADKMWPDDPKESDAVRAEVRINKRRWIDEVAAAYEGIFRIEDPKSIEVYSLEMQIDGMEIEGVPANGFIDRTRYGTRNGVRGLVAEDYKTGKIPRQGRGFGDDHGDQLRVYAAALKEKTGEMPIGAKVLYTKFGESKVVDISDRAMKKTLDVWKNSWMRHNKYMKAATFPTKDGPLCGWCPLVDACPSAKANDRVARKEGLPTATDLGIPTLRKGAATPDEVIVPAPVEAPAAVAFEVPADSGISAEDAAAVERVAVSAAHIGGSTTDTDFHTLEDADMTITETTPYTERTKEGELNPNSWAATAAFGITSLAVECLDKAGVELNGTNVKALAQTFHYVVAQAQHSWTGSTSLMDGANTRLRGALRTAIETIPLPFGQEKSAWDEWATKAITRCRAITGVALFVHSEAADDTSWAPLAGLGTPVAAKTETAKASAPARTTRKKPEPVKETVVEEAPAKVEEKAEEPAPAPVAEAKPAKAKSLDEDFGFPDADFIPDDVAAA